MIVTDGQSYIWGIEGQSFGHGKMINPTDYHVDYHLIYHGVFPR